MRKRKAKRQVDDDQVDNDARRAPEPDNLTGAQAEARPEATVTEAEPEATVTEAIGAEAAETVEDTGTAEPEAAEAAAPLDDGEAPDAPETHEGEEAQATESGTAEGEAAEGEAAAAADAGEQPEPAEQPEEETADAEPSVGEDAEEAVVAELVAARAQADGYLDDLRRLQAEFDNYRKRTMREQTARIASASQALVAKLLPVLDNFELAVSHAEQSRDFDRMLKGVEMVFGELREVLSGEGLVSIEAEGKPFDPERHEAVVAVEQDGAEAGTVVDVIRKGYEFNGRVLRPAMVKVAR
ncbi:MAG TPA: nucleotide exchange factor GrpE [Actinomycetes bacterium]|nr:nucleotide exchange factor GrpE [Actinomycetes bacterium]